eukprot:30432-Hanusia_phi.AAC.1
MLACWQAEDRLDVQPRGRGFREGGSGNRTCEVSKNDIEARSGYLTESQPQGSGRSGGRNAY